MENQNHEISIDATQTNISTNIMDPLFEVLLHDPAYIKFWTEKGKICITNHKVPRPETVDDTTVPQIKYNNIVINPYKYKADKKERKRTKEELAAFEGWRQDIKKRQAAMVAEKEATRVRTEEQKVQHATQLKEKRKQTATESKSLVWWISYQASTEFIGGDQCI